MCACPQKHLLCQPKHLSSMFDEYYFMNDSMDQIKYVCVCTQLVKHVAYIAYG